MDGILLLPIHHHEEHMREEVLQDVQELLIDLCLLLLQEIQELDDSLSPPGIRQDVLRVFLGEAVVCHQFGQDLGHIEGADQHWPSLHQLLFVFGFHDESSTNFWGEKVSWLDFISGVWRLDTVG